MADTHASGSANVAASSSSSSSSCSYSYNPNDRATASLNSIPYLLHQYCHDDPKKLNDFRLPELDALCQLVGAPRCYTPSEVIYSSPFLPTRFPSEDHIKQMAARSILVTRWCEVWAKGSSFEQCLQQLKQNVASASYVSSFVANESVSYDLRVHTYGLTPPQDVIASQREQCLEAMQMKGKLVPGSNTVQRFFLFADYGSAVVNPSRTLRNMYLVREICGETFNNLENDYRLNARTFIGPTSMPPNLAFIMSNLAQVTHKSIVYDPFVGTGSLLVSAGHFGALCIGADLDWKILHGKTKKGNISAKDNFKQYKLRAPELICGDMSVNHWVTRSAGLVDAIVCDPPYGVRAGARKTGRAEGKEVRTVDPEMQSTHIPTTQLYDVEDVIHDMLDNAAIILKMGGRLIYWLPTTTDFKNEELPSHPCLRLISVCEQVVRSHFSRRLITLEKYVTFDESKRMHRRNKLTEPPPKYANLKETIIQLSEEGPIGGTAKTAPENSNNEDAATSSNFVPPPVSKGSLKRIAKLERIREMSARETAVNGGVKLSRKQRNEQRVRLPEEEYRRQQKEKHLAALAERRALEAEKTADGGKESAKLDAQATSSSSSSAVDGPPSPAEPAHKKQKLDS